MTKFNQIKYYVVQVNESHSNSQRIFYEKSFNLHETTLKVIIILKNDQVDEALALKVNNDLEFINQALQSLLKSCQNVRLLELEEFRHKRMEIKYQIDIAEISRKKIEDPYLKQKKIWDSINENLQQNWIFYFLYLR